MVEKLAELCARAVAQDPTDKGWCKLRFLFEAAVPTSVYSTLFSWLPMNRLLENEESFPDQQLLEELWQKLCERCASKHPPILQKLEEAVEKGETPNYRQTLLNAYFEEVMSACCDVDSLNDRETKLQEALGENRHITSHSEMFVLLSHHTTELYLFPRRMPFVQDLIKTNSSCLREVKSLRLETCQIFGDRNLKCDETVTALWTFCLGHVFCNAKVEVIRATRCCGFIGRAIQSSVRDHSWAPNISIEYEDDADCMSGARESKDGEVEEDNIVSDRRIEAYEPRVAANVGVKVLTLSPCTARHYPGHFSGLEFFSNLERLSITSGSTRNIVFDPIFPSITRMLREREMSRIRFLYLARIKLMNVKALETFAKYLVEANNFKKYVILERTTLVQQPSDSVSNPVVINLYTDSSVQCLALSGIVTKPLDTRARPHAPVLQYLLFTLNPEHLLICCDGRRLDVLEPLFPLPSPPAFTERRRVRLRKLTVIYQKLPSDEKHYRPRRALPDVLKDVITVLQSETKHVDLFIYRDQDKVIDEENCYYFKSYESGFREIPAEDFGE